MKTSESLKELAPALAKVHSGLLNPEKNQTAKIPTKAGGQYEYSYAGLPGMLDCNKTLLGDNGFSLPCTLEFTPTEALLTMRLLHSSGEWIESSYPLPGNVGPKELAAEITYGRRYLYQALVGIAGDEDTDSAPEMPKVPEKKQGAFEKGLSSVPKVSPVKPASNPTMIPTVVTTQAEAPSPGKWVSSSDKWVPSEQDLKNLKTLREARYWTAEQVTNFMGKRFRKTRLSDLTALEFESMVNTIETVSPIAAMELKYEPYAPAPGDFGWEPGSNG